MTEFKNIAMDHGRFILLSTILLACDLLALNPLTAGAAHIRVFIIYQHIKHHI